MRKIQIEEIPVDRIEEFWEIHFPYLRDDVIITDEEDLLYFQSGEYRDIIKAHMIRSVDPHHMVYFVCNRIRIGAAQYNTYQSEDGKCFILDFWVFPEFRGNGTGHLCFEALRQYTSVDGARYYEINCDKEDAHRFWSSLGFVDCGVDEYEMPLMQLHVTYNMTREQIIHNLMGKPIHVVVDRPAGYLHGDILYPINYGYIPGLIAGDGEEQDAYILGISDPITKFDGQVVAAICRKNDCEDKLVVAPVGREYHQGQIAEAVHFQEQSFDTHIVSCFEKSCGVLPYRMVSGQQEFLLVFETYSKCWSLPKGHIETGESDVQAALRELFEETGLTATLDTSRCASLEYPISSFARKQVTFFLGEVTGVPKVREGEIDKFKWVTAEELKDYLFPDTYEACKALLR